MSLPYVSSLGNYRNVLSVCVSKRLQVRNKELRISSFPKEKCDKKFTHFIACAGECEMAWGMTYVSLTPIQNTTLNDGNQLKDNYRTLETFSIIKLNRGNLSQITRRALHFDHWRWTSNNFIGFQGCYFYWTTLFFHQIILLKSSWSIIYTR